MFNMFDFSGGGPEGVGRGRGGGVTEMHSTTLQYVNAKSTF